MSAPLFTLALAGQLVAASGMLPPPSPVSVRDGFDIQAAQASAQQVQFDATRFDSLTALSLRSFLDSAVEQGIPTGPLINRALEGSARKKSGAEIMRVVRAHAAALAQAMEVLGPTAPVAELDAGATALRAGIDVASLAAVRAARPVGSVTVPLMVLTDIKQRGVPINAARDAVTAITRMPSSDEALNGLRETVAKNSLRGPGMAVDALNRYLKGTVPGSNPSSAPAAPDRKPIRPPSP
ncbi:MAG: hypothetical protein IPP90_05110 [Gemmatimonadaceae bacterium]|nr:hypothetical protein [Gemmatimonadaceae bacterium]